MDSQLIDAPKLAQQIPPYSGQASHTAWLISYSHSQPPIPNRTAVAEGWINDVKRRAEPGAQYDVEKRKVCHLCPHQLPNAEILKYLSKVLYYQDQRATMLANQPVDLD